MSLTNILQEEEIIANDIVEDMEDVDDLVLSDGKVSSNRAQAILPLSPLPPSKKIPSKVHPDCSASPLIDPLSSKQCFNLSYELSNPLLMSPSMMPPDLEMHLDQKTQILLQDYMMMMRIWIFLWKLPEL